MKISKVATASARRLFGLCMAGGKLNEDQLRAVCAKLISEKPRDFLGILQGLQKLTRLEFERRAATVESSAPLDALSRDRVAAGLAKQYGDDLLIQYVVTPELLGGLRIRVGNDVLDGSVQGRLDRLMKAF